MSSSTSQVEETRAPGTMESSPAYTEQAFPVQRFLIFAALVLLILLVVNGIVCATVGYFFGMPGWLLWQAVPALLVVAFLVTTALGFRHSTALLRTVYAVSATWLGILNFAFFAACACWIFYGADLLVGQPVPRVDVAGGFFGLALVLAVYGIINAAWIRETSIRVPLPNLPTAWEGRTVALVTDLHLGHVSGPRFLERIISRLRAAQPAAVLIGGDMFDGSPVELDRLVVPWKNYSAPRGIFYVAGNHDEFAAREIYWNAVAGTGIRVLQNEKVIIDGLQLIGVHDSEAGDAVELRNILRRSRIDRSSPSLLLAHRPGNLAVAEEEGVSLQLSGHTHRGQLWPWTWLVSRIYGPFAYGLQRAGRLLVYTSSGVGTWGPPLRVGTRSEIVFLRLERAVID